MSKNLAVTIGGVVLKNPVMTASGTFGSGKEYGEFVDLNKLGAVVVKGVSGEPWHGNNPPRIAEVYGGMLNSVGLQNPGVDYFIREDIPFLRKFDTKIIVNICGHTVSEYCSVAEKLRGADIDLIELNISCPNISEGGIAFGSDPKRVFEIVSMVKKHADKPLIVKLSPNVTDIKEIALSAEAGGADALSLINTITGMKIDIYKREPVLKNKIGGMSGPAIKPIAVRMVYQTRQAVKLPIIGMGGIQNAEDAIEFIMAGATAVAVGTANFINPYATEDILDGITDYMVRYDVKDINDICGIVQ